MIAAAVSGVMTVGIPLWLSLSLSVCRSVSVSASLFVYFLSVYLFVYFLSVYPFVFLHLSVSLCVSCSSNELVEVSLVIKKRFFVKYADHYDEGDFVNI